MSGGKTTWRKDNADLISEPHPLYRSRGVGLPHNLQGHLHSFAQHCPDLRCRLLSSKEMRDDKGAASHSEHVFFFWFCVCEVFVESSLCVCVCGHPKNKWKKEVLTGAATIAASRSAIAFTKDEVSPWLMLMSARKSIASTLCCHTHTHTYTQKLFQKNWKMPKHVRDTLSLSKTTVQSPNAAHIPDRKRISYMVNRRASETLGTLSKYDLKRKVEITITITGLVRFLSFQKKFCLVSNTRSNSLA